MAATASEAPSISGSLGIGAQLFQQRRFLVAGEAGGGGSVHASSFLPTTGPRRLIVLLVLVLREMLAMRFCVSDIQQAFLRMG